VSRNTVRKVLRSGETSFEYERDVQPRPKLGRWAGSVASLALVYGLAEPRWVSDQAMRRPHRAGLRSDEAAPDAASGMRSPLVNLWLLGNFSIVGTSTPGTSIAAPVRLELSVIGDMASKMPTRVSP
jgi:hypothetical protein